VYGAAERDSALDERGLEFDRGVRAYLSGFQEVRVQEQSFLIGPRYGH
jgi:hypothetical protein